MKGVRIPIQNTETSGTWEGEDDSFCFTDSFDNKLDGLEFLYDSELDKKVAFWAQLLC